MLKEHFPSADELVELAREIAGVFLIKYIASQDPHKAYRGNLLGSPDLKSFAGGWEPKVRGRLSEAWAWLEIAWYVRQERVLRTMTAGSPSC